MAWCMAWIVDSSAVCAMHDKKVCKIVYAFCCMQPTDSYVRRHRNKKQKDRDTKRYRLKRAIQRAVMRNIIASDSAFSSDVHIASVKKKHPAGMLNQQHQ
jgi:hypothetical protein